MAVQAFDGVAWGDWTTFNLTTTTTDAPPTVSAAIIPLHDLQWWLAGDRLRSLTSDPEGDPITKYELIDRGTDSNSAYLWTPGNHHVAANTVLDVDAADLGNLWVQGGTVNASETMSVRAFDGTQWGAWTDITITTINFPPVVTQTATADGALNRWIKLADYISVADPNGEAMQQIKIDPWANFDGSYLWTPTNSHVSGSLTVSPADLANVWIHAPSSAGTDTYQISAFDGYDWSNPTTFSVTGENNRAPTLSVDNAILGENQWARITDWLHFQDPDGDPVTQYEISPNGAMDGGNPFAGYIWTPSNSHLPPGSFDFSPADINNVWVYSGSVHDTLSFYIKASDGTHWSDSAQLSVTTL